MSVAEIKCTNCDTVSREDVFCPHCGQKHPQAGDLSFANAWRRVVEEVLNVDGRIFHTLKALFTRPGQLTLDFLEGRRTRYVHPLRLFLIFSAVYFLVEGTAMSSRITSTSGVLTDTTSELERAQIEAVGHFAFKIAFIGAVVVNALLFWLFFHRRRPLFGENMVTALHLSCVTMTLTVAVGMTARILGIDNMVGGFTGGLFGAFGGFTIKRVYHEPSSWLLGPCVVAIIVIDILIVTLTTAAAIHYQAAAFN